MTYLNFVIETLEGMDTVYFGSDNQYWVEFVTNGYFTNWYIDYGVVEDGEDESMGKIHIEYYFESFAELFSGECNCIDEWVDEILSYLDGYVFDECEEENECEEEDEW